MIKLDDNLLQELGLGQLPPDEKKKMLAHIYETLEMRVGMELAKQMTDAQLNEFEEFIKRNDEAGALRWLETNFPNYKSVVASEFDKLKLEVKQVAPHIVASAQQHASMHQPQGGVAPQPPMPQPGYHQPSHYAAQPTPPVHPAQQQGTMPSQPQYPPHHAQPPQYPHHPGSNGQPAPEQHRPHPSDYDLAA